MIVWKVALMGALVGFVSIFALSFPMKWRFAWPMPLVGLAGAILAHIISIIIGEFTVMGEGKILIAAAIGAFITSGLARYAAWLGQRQQE